MATLSLGAGVTYIRWENCSDIPAKLYTSLCRCGNGNEDRSGKLDFGVFLRVIQSFFANNYIHNLTIEIGKN